MNRELVKIKGIGVQDSLLMILDDQVSFPVLLDYMEDKFSNSDDFFNGGEVIINIGERKLSNRQKITLLQLLEDEYGVKIHNLINDEHLLYPEQKPQDSPAADRNDDGGTRFIKATVRSGQEIKYDGNIVIMGDINPGAEVIASGNILIFGTVRGVVHAGATGDKGAFICALRLDPIQLRIAEYIARAPDSDKSRPEQPEICEVIGEQVVIRSFTS